MADNAPKRGRRGRPPKLTLAKVRAVAARIGKGIPEEYACILSGVNYKTWQSAKERPEFSGAVKRAAAKFIEEALGIISAGGEVVTMMGAEGPREAVRPWTGRAWILERRHPEHFRRQPEVAFSSVTNNTQVSFTEEQWAEWRKAAQQQFIVGPLAGVANAPPGAGTGARPGEGASKGRRA